MDGGDALWGGFTSFFSIWQICILQFSPFFLAFIAGVYLAAARARPAVALGRWIVLPCVGYSIAFTLFYSLLIASGLQLSRPLIHNIGLLRLISGVVIMLAGLHLVLLDRVLWLGRMHRPLPLCVASVLIGIAFALIYSPCITPMLSDIMGLASQRATAETGWFLAFAYGLGISAALCATSVALIVVARRWGMVLRQADSLRRACGAILLLLAAMNLTGLMGLYKALVLGLVL